MPSINYSTTAVRYIGQHYNIANFTYFSEYYPAGAAHGMHHSDYVIFDLNTKQRLSLNDILAPASKENSKLNFTNIIVSGLNNIILSKMHLK